MNEYIAYCGLDCETCDARIATVNDDAALRQKTALLHDMKQGGLCDGFYRDSR